MRQPGQLADRLREDGLAGCRAAADDQHQRATRAPGQPAGQPGKPVRLRDRHGPLVAPRELSRQQARHLRADPGPVRRVEEQQLRPSVVAARRAVLVDQGLREVLGAEVDQIHDQEGELGADVDLAERRIELEWIEHLHRSRFEDHVLGAQVAVAVTHEAAGDALLEQTAPRVQERDGEQMCGCEFPLSEQWRIRQQGAEVLADGGGDGFRVETALRRLRRGQVKLSDPPCHGSHRRFVCVAAAQHRGKRLFRVETPHLDYVLDSVIP